MNKASARHETPARTPRRHALGRRKVDPPKNDRDEQPGHRRLGDKCQRRSPLGECPTHQLYLLMYPSLIMTESADPIQW